MSDQSQLRAIIDAVDNQLATDGKPYKDLWRLMGADLGYTRTTLPTFITAVGDRLAKYKPPYVLAAPPELSGPKGLKMSLNDFIDALDAATDQAAA